MFKSCFIRTTSLFILTSLAILLSGCPIGTAPTFFVVVPSLSGLTQSEATSALANVNLTIGEITTESNETVPVGQVIRQDPIADTEVELESAVALVISTGSGVVIAVPNLVGMTQANALTALTSAGLTMGAVKQESSATIPAGYVISQNPASGMSVSPGLAVAIVVSCGPQPVTVPNVVGVAQIYAEAAIHNRGLVVGTVTQENSTTVPSGNVIRQTPEGGTTVARGTSVNLVISVKVAAYSVPNVMGMTLDAARTAITNAKLTVGMVTHEYNAKVPEGSVIDQNPTMASEVPQGSAVNLVLATTGNSDQKMSITPSVHKVSTSAGTTTFEVSNTGIGTMRWTASVTTGSWLRITSGVSGANSGTITVSYDANTNNNSRIGTIQVTAPAVTNGTQQVNVQQAGIAPMVMSFAINNGAATTTTTSVTLTNVCTGDPTHFMASESASFSGASWQTYATESSFTLSSGSGIKTVYFKVKNGGSESEVVSDTITLNENIAGTEQTIFLPDNVPLVMVWCPAGTFMMGATANEQDSYDWEKPQHQVTLTQGFWMGKYELTKRQWTAVMGTTPWLGKIDVIDDPNSPAVYVSWLDAQSFLAALNSFTGQTFHLPTESQWEYACRAGTTTRFYWGDDPNYTQINNFAWWSGNARSVNESYAHVVGQKLPNAWGLYDMSGNVCEWCQDWWAYGYTDGAVTNPTGPATGSGRMLRGGSYYNNSADCRSADRRYDYPWYQFFNFGFRLSR